MGRGSTVLTLGIVLAVLVGAVGAVGPVAGAPTPPPAAYYGSLTVDGDPAPAGLTVTAEIDGEQRGSLTTGDTGRYGGPGAFDPKLTVDGTDDDEGATVHFFVEGQPAGTATWRSGDVLEVTLSATGVSVPTPGQGSGDGSGGGGPLVPPSTPAETPTEPGSSSGPTVTVTRSGGEVGVAVTDARAGEEVEVQIDTTSDGIGLDSIAITPNVNGSFTLNASLLANPPAGTPPLPAGGDGIGFLQVDHSIADADIDGVTFRFRVSKQRLADAGLDPDAVTLSRLHEGEWSPLPTTRVDESTMDYVFEADSPGLSLFAIGQQSGDESTPTESETPVSTSVPADDEPPDTEARTDGSGPRFGSLIAVLALLSTVAVLRYRHR